MKSVHVQSMCVHVWVVVYLQSLLEHYISPAFPILLLLWALAAVFSATVHLHGRHWAKEGGCCTFMARLKLQL